MSKAASLCIYCGKPGVTMEHVLPRWLDDHDLPRSNVRVHHASLMGRDPDTGKWGVVEFRESKREGDPHRKKLPIACGSCNNGWMSRLQVRARPIVSQLVDGRYLQLSKAHLDVLTSWCAMTAISTEYEDRPTQTTDQNQRSDLHRRVLDGQYGMHPAWRVAIGRYNGTHSGCRNNVPIAAVPFGEDETPDLALGQRVGIHSTVVIGCLIFTCFNLVGESYDLLFEDITELFNKYKLVETTRPTVFGRVTPKRTILDREANEVAAGFAIEDLWGDLRPMIHRPLSDRATYAELSMMRVYGADESAL